MEAFPEDTAPRFLVRDRDNIYGERFRRTAEALAIQRTRAGRARISGRRLVLVEEPPAVLDGDYVDGADELLIEHLAGVGVVDVDLEPRLD